MAGLRGTIVIVLTLAVYGLLAIAVIGILFLLGVYVLPKGVQIAPPVRDGVVWQLVEGRALTPEDVVEVKLPVSVRGYRFAETDLLLDRLTDELRARDHEIALLRGYGYQAVAVDLTKPDDLALAAPEDLDAADDLWTPPPGHRAGSSDG